MMEITPKNLTQESAAIWGLSGKWKRMVLHTDRTGTMSEDASVLNEHNRFMKALYAVTNAI